MVKIHTPLFTPFFVLPVQISCFQAGRTGRARLLFLMKQSRKEKKPQINQDVVLLQGFFTTLPPWSSFSQWFQNVQFIAAMAVSGKGNK